MRRMRNGAVGPGFGRLMLLVVVIIGLSAGQASGAYVDVSKSAGSRDALHGLQLAGTVEGANQLLTGAVFEDPRTKKQTAYRIGDLVDGATIVDIKRQQVVLKRGEEVFVVQITGGSPVAGPPNRSPIERTPGDVIPVPAGDAGLARQFVISKVIAAYDPRVEQLKTPVSRKDVKRFASYFQEQLKNEAPVFATTPQVGQTVGLGNVDTEIFQRLSLESTDQIVSINGMGVDSPDEFRKILDILGGDRVSMFNIVVLRGEAVQPLYYAVK